MFKASEIHRLASLTESFFSEAKGFTLPELIAMELTPMLKAVRSLPALKDKPVLTKRVIEGIAMIKQMRSHGGKVRTQELKALEKIFPFKDVQTAMSEALQAYNKKIGYDPISMTQKESKIEERMTTPASGFANYQQTRGAKPSFKSRMKPEDEKLLAVLKAKLLSTPLKDKQKIMDQIQSIQSKYESISNETQSLKESLSLELTSGDKDTVDLVGKRLKKAGIKFLLKPDSHKITSGELNGRKVGVSIKPLAGDSTYKVLVSKDDYDRAMYVMRSTPVKESKGKWARLAESHFQMEGGPGSGGQYPTRKLKMPMSPFISVGTRKGILKNMPFDLEDVPLAKITHVAQAKFVPQKVKNLCKNPEVITKYPVCLLKIPSQDCYHVMDGHHRFLAAQKLGIENLPAKVWLKYEEEPAPAETPSEQPEAVQELLPIDASPEGENPAAAADPAPSEAMPLPEPEDPPQPNPEMLAPDDSANAMSEVPSEVPGPDSTAPDIAIVGVPGEHDHYEVMCEKCNKVTESCGCMAEEKAKRTTVCETCKTMSFIESKKLPMSLKDALKVLGSKGSF